MEFKGQDSCTLDRQIRDGVFITEDTGVELVNMKGEWGHNATPKFGMLDEVRGQKRIGRVARPVSKKTERETKGE